MAAAVTVPEDAIRLVREAEEIRERLARKEQNPAERLQEIETALDEHWDRQAAARERAQAEYEAILAEYEPARDAADEATRALVSTVTRAVELRRQLEAARKRAGTSAPPKASVRAASDKPFRELRQNARLAAGSNY